MRVHFTAQGWQDYLSWQNDRETAAKIGNLIEAVRRDPFRGEGKPEALKGNWQGWWSRRISREHRLVYAVEGRQEEQRVVIARCRDHY